MVETPERVMHSVSIRRRMQCMVPVSIGSSVSAKPPWLSIAASKVENNALLPNKALS